MNLTTIYLPALESPIIYTATTTLTEPPQSLLSLKAALNQAGIRPKGRFFPSRITEDNLLVFIQAGEGALEASQLSQQSSALQAEVETYRLYQLAIPYAQLVHGDQKYDKTKPYFYHLNQVDRVVTHFFNEIPIGEMMKLKTAAILHDVIEDTPITQAELAQAFTPEIAQLVENVSEFDEAGKMMEDEAYYKKIASHPLSAIIKLADKCANTKQTTINGSAFHIEKSIRIHPLIEARLYPLVTAPKMKAYLDSLIAKVEKG